MDLVEYRFKVAELGGDMRLQPVQFFLRIQFGRLSLTRVLEVAGAARLAAAVGFLPLREGIDAAEMLLPFLR